MPPSQVKKVTETVRSDHTQWQCSSCQTLNSMTEEICSNCSRSRIGQSLAVTASGEIIGGNAGKNSAGKEEWYYNVTVNEGDKGTESIWSSILAWGDARLSSDLFMNREAWYELNLHSNTMPTMLNAIGPDCRVIETTDVHPNHSHWKCKNCGDRQALFARNCRECGTEIYRNAWVVTDGGQIFGQMCQMDHLGRVIWRYVVRHDGHVPEETEHFCGECYKCMWTRKWNIILGYEKP
ncbi:hypothetical protein HYE68_005388 [Fusarium pseudograminearum]|nr:hypothetical protein HYE68_005388 [Fusarium pseudograminearum]